MDFSAVARQARGGVGESFELTAADVVSGSNLSATFLKTYSEEINVGSELAAEVVALTRGVTCGKHGSRSSSHHEHANMSTVTLGDRARRWRIFDARLTEIQSRLSRNKIPSRVFQDQLIASLRCQEKVQVDADRDTSLPNGDADPVYGTTSCVATDQEGPNGWSPRPLCVLWRLHDVGLLPLFRLLEASEMAPSPFDTGFRGGGEGLSDSLEEPFKDFADTIVGDMRELACECAENANRLGHRRRQVNEVSSPLVDIAQHLFDIAYHKLPDESGAMVGGKQSGEALSTRAARRVLDRLCCGKEFFGSSKTGPDLETRLRGCAAILSAIDPLLPPRGSALKESNGVMGFEGGIDISEAPIASSANRDRDTPTSVVVLQDERTADFLDRQFRCLVDNASGLTGLIDKEEAGAFEAEMSSLGRVNRVLVDIMRHFRPTLIIDTLRSICRRIISLASDATGSLLLKPLLQWETFGPIVRAAASVHPQSIPLAVAAMGTELAAAAVNVVPVEDFGGARVSQDQGVLVLSASLRLVGQADRRSHNAPCNAIISDGLYSQWMHSCFGATAAIVVESGSAQKIDDVAVEPSLPPGRSEQAAKDSDVAQTHRPEMVRLVMERQGASEVLMRALCLSVPYDQAFVLEVHRDVLKSRLRVNFSIQVRDYLDLVETRLSDLRVQGRDGGRGAARKTRNDSRRGDRMGRLSGDSGDPTRREIGFFLRQFKQTGQVPSALKTAILWQPKSWTKYRKVLLASPGERIAIPDEHGNIEGIEQFNGEVKETIGHGEKGLRVEVSLKYRRLLVQQLAKDKLLSAKDHEAFRQSYVEFLHGQRDRDAAKRHQGHQGHQEESEPLTDMTRQLLLLESRMGEGGYKEGHDSGSVPGGKGDIASVQHKLALLLQEYLPRALVVELCIEDDESCRVPSKVPVEASRSPDGRDWFRRATDFLTGILGQWERCYKIGRAPQLDPSSKALASHTDITPQVVAEAILNSIHCCIAAVGVSVGQDLLAPLSNEPEFLSQLPTSARDKKQGPTGGSMENEKRNVESASGTHITPTGLRVDGAVKTLRLIGRLVASAAVNAVGKALCERCFNLLSSPTRLDVKQVVSVTHVIASMPSVLHPKVENLWTDLIRETLQRTPVDGAGDRWEAAVQHAKKHKNRGMGLLALTQIVALYLQSTALLHDKLVTCSSDGVDDEGCPDPHGDGTSRQSKTVGNGRGRRGLVGECNDSASSLDMQSVGCAPIILLDVAWWMERRLTSARCRNELLPVVGIVKMSQLLHNVVEHPTVKRAFNRTFAKGEAKPPLDRVIELEVAISKLDDVIPASSKLSSLESVILGQLPMRSSCRSEYVEQEGAKHYSTSMQMSTSSDAIKGTRDKWNGCVTVLVKNSSLRNAAYRMVYRDQARHDPGIVLESYGRSLKSDCEDPECLSSSDRRHGRSCGVDGVQTLLTCILDVMRNLCALEATAGSISWPSGGHKPSPEKGQTSCGQSKGQTGERGVSMLLTETIAIFNNAGATCECGIFSVLILIAEVAIPMIGATEGPAKAIELLHLMWQKWLCRTRTRTRTRPLEYGVVLKLTRMSFMLYGGHHRVSGEGSDRLQGCWVVSMLEDFPSLTGEMADVWPSLTRSLQPLINVAGGSRDTGHRERDDWLEHLSILHIVGKELLQLLTGGGLGTPLSAPTQRSNLWRDDRRIPLEPVHNGPQGQTSGSDHSPSGEQVDWQEDQVYVRDVHAGHEAQRTMLRITELAQSSSCDTTKALPRSLSLVILNALDTAAVMLIETTKKRPHQELATAAVGTKRNKSAGAARVRASEDLPELLHGRESDKVDPQSFRSWHRHFKPTQWATCLLKPLFGEASERCNLSSVSTLLETMVGALGNPGRKEFEGDELKGLARSLKKSLVIGILEYAPSLVARVAEAPFLASSDLLVAPAESMRRSITLLDCLKGLSEEVLRRFMAEPIAWLTTVLSHYGAVLHTMANVSSMDTAVECIKGHEWKLVVAFVHSQIRGISRRQLRLIPAAVALQEVDPLLKQYF